MSFLPPVINGVLVERSNKSVRRKKKRHRRKKAQKKELTKIKRPDYKEYMKSHRWLKRRKEYKKECAACGYKKNLNLHHKTYERLGNELRDDLVYLCSFCHQKFHEHAGIKKNMVKETNAFIKEVKKNRTVMEELRDVDNFIKSI